MTIKTHYSNKAASLDEQVDFFKHCGIYIENETAAKQYLLFIGYYRLFGYVRPFLQTPEYKFSFEQVLELYAFDRELRLLVIDAIERIEVAFRVSISEVMSNQYNPFWYTQDQHFKYIKWHREFMDKVVKLTTKQEHRLIKQYYNNYNSPPFPPSWIITECLTFGTWSKVFDNLKKRQDKITVANRLQLRLMNLLSWIKCLTELRNLCAHHERIWNHFYKYTPKEVPDLSHQSHRFYQQAYVLDEMLKKISPYADWKEKLQKLMEKYKHLPLEKMGFFNNWQDDPFWKHETTAPAPRGI